MKVQAIEAKIWWICLADEIRPVAGSAVVDSVREFSKAFRFAAAPTQLPDGKDGYRFSEGSASVKDTTVAIKEVVVFNDGLSVHVYSHSSDAEAILEQIRAFMRVHGFRDPTTPPGMAYNSTIIFDLDGPLDVLVEEYDSISKNIRGTMEMVEAPKVRAIDFGIDPKLAPPLSPLTFKIERRENTPWELNRFFSFATTTTDRHLSLLDDIEARVRRRN